MNVIEIQIMCMIDHHTCNFPITIHEKLWNVTYIEHKEKLKANMILYILKELIALSFHYLEKCHFSILLGSCKLQETKATLFIFLPGTHSHIKNDEFPKYKLQDSDDFLLSDDANASPVKTMEKLRSRKTKHQSVEERHATRSTTKQGSEVKTHSRGHSASQKKSHQREKRRKSRTERNKQRAQKQQQVLVVVCIKFCKMLSMMCALTNVGFILYVMWHHKMDGK